jgi:hypothetical protein
LDIGRNESIVRYIFDYIEKESHIFHLIYQYHSCDSWEDIFRDYDKTYLKDKAKGVKIAIKYIKNELKNVDRKQDLSVLTAETDV